MAIPNRLAILESDGTTDTAFALPFGLNAAGRCVQVGADGQIVVGGEFTQIDIYDRIRLASVGQDGTVSPDNANTNGTVNTIIGQTDGKFIIGGAFTAIGSNSRSRLARIASNLLVEEAYAPTFNGTVNALAQQEDGKTLAGGSFATVSGVARANIVRLYNDAAPTNLTVENVDLIQWLRSGSSQEVTRVSFEEPAGTPIAGVITRINGGWQFVPTASLTGTGTITARAYTTDSHSEGILEDTVDYEVNPLIEISVDGAVIPFTPVDTIDFADTQVGSTTSNVFTIKNIGLDVLTLTGTPVVISSTNADQWNPVAQPSTPINPGSSVTFTLDFTPTSAGAKVAILTINSDDATHGTFVINLTGEAVHGPGGIDATWQPSLNALTYTPAISKGEEIWLGGNFTSINSLGRNRYARLNLSGVVQNQTGSGANNSIYAMCHLPDGKVLIGGTFTSVNGVARNRLARLNSDGSLDASFNVSFSSYITGFALEATGNVLVCGPSWSTVGGIAVNTGIVRLLMPSGALDTSFTASQFNIYAAYVQTDGKIMVTRQAGSSCLFRLNADGSLDGTFAPVFSTIADVSCAVPTQDGKVVCGGTFTTINGAAHTGVIRLTSVGAYDNTFADIATYPLSMQMQCDERLLIGAYTSGSLAATERLTRVLTTGANDPTFVATARNYVSGIVSQEDGKVVLTGQFTLSGSATKYASRVINDINGASSSLSVVSPTQVQWIRTGTAPNVQVVTFSYSQDGGTTWVSLGQGTRLANGWQLTGISLPISGILRGQAVVQCGRYNGSVTIHEDQVAFSNLEVGDLVLEYPIGTIIADGGTLTFAGTLPGQFIDYTVTLRNTGLADVTAITASIPTSPWTIIGAPLATLAPNQTTTVVVRFAPTTVGAASAVNLRIESSVPGAKNPYLILLQGNGVAVPTATTTNSTSPGTGQRTFNGSFRANHDTANAYFQFKLASSSVWTDTTPPQAISGFVNVTVGKTVSGLSVGQSYNWRAIIYNAVNAGQAPAAPFVGSTGTFTAT